MISIISLKIGAVPITFFGDNHFVLLSLRLPRVILCWMVGHLLAIAGTYMQVITRNPLGSPDILGIHAGASLAGILYVLFFPQLPAQLLPFFAFGGGLFFAAIIFFLAHIKRLSSIGLALVGVALQILSTSLIQLIIHVKTIEIHTALAWLAGSFWGRSWEQIYYSSFLFVIIVILSYIGTFRLKILFLQDELIIGLGENISSLRFSFFLLATLASSLSVALVGPISFIALLAPPIGRMLGGPQLKRIIPLASLVGTILLIVADSLGRGLMPPLEFPAGLLTPIIGVPYFFYLLKKTASTSSLQSEAING